MKLFFNKLQVKNNTDIIRVSLDNGQTETEYNISEVKTEGVPIPEGTFFDEIKLSNTDDNTSTQTSMPELELDVLKHVNTNGCLVSPDLPVIKVDISLSTSHTEKGNFDYSISDGKFLVDAYKEINDISSDFDFKKDFIHLELNNYIEPGNTGSFYLDNEHYTKESFDEMADYEKAYREAMNKMLDEIWSYDAYMTIDGFKVPIVLEFGKESNRIFFKDLQNTNRTIKISFDGGQTENEYDVEELVRYGLEVPEGVDLNGLIIKGTNKSIKKNFDSVKHKEFDLKERPSISYNFFFESSTSDARFNYTINSGRVWIDILRYADNIQKFSTLSDLDNGIVDLSLHNRIHMNTFEDAPIQEPCYLDDMAYYVSDFYPKTTFEEWSKTSNNYIQCVPDGNFEDYKDMIKNRFSKSYYYIEYDSNYNNQYEEWKGFTLDEIVIQNWVLENSGRSLEDFESDDSLKAFIKEYLENNKDSYRYFFEDNRLNYFYTNYYSELEDYINTLNHLEYESFRYDEAYPQYIEKYDEAKRKMWDEISRYEETHDEYVLIDDKFRIDIDYL